MTSGVSKRMKGVLTMFLGRGAYATENRRVVSTGDTLWVDGGLVASWEGDRLQVHESFTGSNERLVEALREAQAENADGKAADR